MEPALHLGLRRGGLPNLLLLFAFRSLRSHRKISKAILLGSRLSAAHEGIHNVIHVLNKGQLEGILGGDLVLVHQLHAFGVELPQGGSDTRHGHSQSVALHLKLQMPTATRSPDLPKTQNNNQHVAACWMHLRRSSSSARRARMNCTRADVLG